MSKEKQRPLDELYVSAQSLVDRPYKIIPVSPILDMALGGGIQEGSLVIPTGPPKVGKTSMCLSFAGNAIKPEYSCDLKPEGREIYFFNIEGRLKKRDLLGIQGLADNIDKIHLIESSPGKIKTAEEYIETAERLINEKPGDIFILDSVSQLCTKGEFDSSFADRYRADAPVLVARFLRRICNVVPVNKSIVMAITHIIANQAGGGPMARTWSEASGRKIQYQVDFKLRATHSEPWEGSAGQQIGQNVHWICESSGLGAPRQKCVSRLRYGYGIDKEAELVELGTNFAIIKKGGAWYEFADGTKCQGLDKARIYLTENPTLYETIYGQIKEMIS